MEKTIKQIKKLPIRNHYDLESGSYKNFVCIDSVIDILKANKEVNLFNFKLT